MLTYAYIPFYFNLEFDNRTLDAIMYILAKIGNKIDIPFQTLPPGIKCVQNIRLYVYISSE